jgi:hypothetical protein
MRNRQSHKLRPILETAEDRCLATVHPLVAYLAHHGLAAQVHGPLTQPRHLGNIIVMDGGPGGQNQLPSGFRSWGVITIWNSTNNKVTFSVAASTYQFGRFFNFTLRPGAHQAYYASFDTFNNPPFFQVSFDPIHRSNAVQLSDINTIFERNSWVPRGDEGRPYAIAIDVSGLYLTPI